MDCLTAFREVIQDTFGLLDWLPVPDGAIHRFHVPGDRQGSENGWYVLYLDGIASGAFGSWKSGGTRTWCSREPVDHQEVLQVRQRVEHARRQREAERLKRQQATAEQAVRIWQRARPVDPLHPYLIAKGTPPHGLRQRFGELLVPLRNAAGALVNLQRIGADGDKRFLYGGQVQGAFHLIGRIAPNQTLYICEGWATGATLFELYDDVYGVACAMNAGNLKPVALALRERFGHVLDMLIASDDDRLTDGNPGWLAANEAAAASGCMVTSPDWPADAPTHLTDFNDLYCWLTSQETEHD